MGGMYRWGSIVLAGCGLASPAVAQENGANSDQIQEIVVTAQKQAQGIQDVPISIAALSGDSLTERQIFDVKGLSGSVPNLEVNSFTNNNFSPVFTIRGLGSAEAQPFQAATVAIVVDEAPQQINYMSLPALYDIERIEVLRGPQGTLFGANTTGGVVSIVSKEPGSEFEGNATLTYGNYDRIVVTGGVTLPIIPDKLSARIGFYHNEADGYYTDVSTGKSMNGEKRSAIRGTLKWTPTDDLTFVLRGEIARVRDEGFGAANASLPGDAQYIPAGTILPNSKFPMYASPCLPVLTGGRCKAPKKYFAGKNSTPGLLDGNTNDVNALTFTAKYDFGAGEITSITAYKDYDLVAFIDNDGSPLFLSSVGSLSKGWQFSQELRANVDLSDQLRLTTGVFFNENKYKYDQIFPANVFGGITQFNYQNQKNSAISGYAQLYFDVSEKLTLQAGIRYTHEKKRMIASTDTYLSADGTSNLDMDIYLGPPNSVLPIDAKKSWNKIGYKIGANFNWSDDAMTYAYYARGFKSGGFVGRVGLPTDIGPFGPETVDTFEFGNKLSLLNRRLTINAALFYNIFKDMQLPLIYFIGTIQGNSILNAAKSRTYGAEIDITARPVRDLTLTFSGAYLNAKYKNFLFPTPGGTPQDLSGFPLNNAPKWSFTAGANWRMSFLPGETVLDVRDRFVSKFYFGALNNVPTSEIQKKNFVDATLSWSPEENASWKISAWATNIFDNRYIASSGAYPGFTAFVNYTPPRQYGVSVDFKW